MRYMLKIYKELLSWVECLLIYMPGAVGINLRRMWYAKHFLIGENLTICEGVFFISPENIKIGDSTSVGANSFFSADGGYINVGNKVAFNRGVHINASVCGEIRIGKMCLFGPNVMVRTADHRFSDPKKYIRDQGHKCENITIEDDVWIGANAVILSGVRIGRGAVIGAGSVVVVDIPSMAIAVGVPAKVIKYRDGKE
jgi:acetyltransferase-like isoleucine patch superfamily enzyme